jgi:Family of unknown function (DUF6056)
MPSRSWSWRLLTIVLIGFLCLPAYLARYAHPMADDLFYAWKYASRGFWAANQWEYLHWNGRFTSNVLVLWAPLRDGLDQLTMYRLVPGLLIALTLFATYTFLRAITGGPQPARAIAAGALVWTALFLHGMPAIGEGFYWYTGAVTYQLANIGALLYASVGCSAWRTGSRWQWMVCALLAFLTVGCNEVIMLMTVVGCVLFTSVCFTRNVKIPGGWWLVLVAVGLGSALMLAAAGNAERGAHFDRAGELGRSLGMSAAQTVRFAVTWSCAGPLLVFSALWMLHHRWLRDQLPGLTRGFGVDARVWSLALVGVIFLCVFPAYWGTGILGQHRTLNVAYFFFLPLWFVHLSAWHHRIQKQAWTWRAIDRQRITSMLHVLIIAAFVLTGHTSEALADLFTGRAQRSDAQLHQRYAQLSEAASGPDRTAYIPLINEPPRTLYVIDLRKADFLVNTDYATWFGLNAVHMDTLTSVNQRR